MTRLTRLLLVLAAVTLVAGCGGVPAASPQLARTPTASVAVAEPTAVRIPALGVDEPLVPLGLNPDGTMEVPPVTAPEVVGWYQPGVRPGEVGPGVLAGHVSGRPAGAEASVPGVFARLADLAPGDVVEIARADDTVAVFEVTEVAAYPKDSFPTDRVWGDVATPQLRVVTCTGTFSESAGSYDSNLVVFATLVSQ